MEEEAKAKDLVDGVRRDLGRGFACPHCGTNDGRLLCCSDSVDTEEMERKHNAIFNEAARLRIALLDVIGVISEHLQ